MVNEEPVYSVPITETAMEQLVKYYMNLYSSTPNLGLDPNDLYDIRERIIEFMVISLCNAAKMITIGGQHRTMVEFEAEGISIENVQDCVAEIINQSKQSKFRNRVYASITKVAHKPEQGSVSQSKSYYSIIFSATEQGMNVGNDFHGWTTKSILQMV